MRQDKTQNGAHENERFLHHFQVCLVKSVVVLCVYIELVLAAVYPIVSCLNVFCLLSITLSPFFYLNRKTKMSPHRRCESTFHLDKKSCYILISQDLVSRDLNDY